MLSLISEIASKKDMPKGLVGVTTHIKMKLQANTPFKVVTRRAPACKKSSNQRAKGLKNGRFLDMLFRDVVGKRTRLNKSKPAHRSLAYVFELLKAKGVVVSKTQVPVSYKELGVRTTLDGLGYTKDAVCVFELKSTTCTLQEHLQRYVL